MSRPGRLTITGRFCLRCQRRPARDSRLNPIAYGTKTGESGFRAWLSGNVDRFNWLGDDLHVAAATLAKQAQTFGLRAGRRLRDR